tara:strand:- start:2796 stop:3485 length:690 start_codon:yes stop_codon:yes gene_type:complete
MAKETIAIIDYGSGNIASAAKAMEHVIKAEGLNAEVLITDKAEDLLEAGRILLPGQGAFGDCMTNLRKSGLIEPLEEAVIQNGTPFLGICVGMQLLATRGLEHGSHEGLDWVKGQVVPIKPDNPDLKIPHMGWNEVHPVSYEGSAFEQDNQHFVLRSTFSSKEVAKHYYFVHSYMFECHYSHHVLGIADYGGPIISIVGRDNILGVQFHPEKSAQDGLELIAAFAKWRP